MVTNLFDGSADGNAGESHHPLDGWMLEALKKHPRDCEALARIGNLQARRDCCFCLMDYRERGYEIVVVMADEARMARLFGRTNIGGIRLAGAIWNRGDEGYEMANETACFYVFILSLLYCDLAPFLACEGAVAKALKLAGWRP